MSSPRGIIVSLLAAGLIASAGQATAQTTDNLAHLVATNGSLTIGDKVFSDFSFLATGLTSFNASQIQVTASFSGGIYYLTWAGNMSLVGTGPVSADLLLNYTVTALGGQIDMIDQLYTGSAQPVGGAFISVDETVRNSQGTLVANSHLQGDDLSDPFAEVGDDLIINPGESVLHVTKDIGFGILNPNGGFVTISQVSQSFHQVPEAGTTAMLAVGAALAGVAAFRRRRKG
jgi:hypothetical protein